MFIKLYAVKGQGRDKDVSDGLIADFSTSSGLSSLSRKKAADIFGE